MDTREFEKLLDKTTALNANNPTAEQQAICNEIQDYVFRYIPKKLFRYRRCDDYSLNAFLNDQLWFATASKMNDDYDSMLSYDKKVVENEIANLFDKDGNIKLFIDIQNGSQYTLNILRNIVGEKELSAYVEGFRKFTAEQIKEESDNFRNWIEQIRTNLENEIISRLQKIVKFACFSERVDSPLMWGHYADSSKGFAIEYDFTNGNTTECPRCPKLGKTCFAPTNGLILPVIYANKRYDATQVYTYILRSFLLDHLLIQRFGFVNVELKQQLLGPIDSLLYTKIILHKAKCWEMEREWRIIYTNSYDPSFSLKDCSYVTKKPTAIYLGRKISPAHQKFLTDVANEKGYKVFKMDVAGNSRTFTMRATPIK